MPPSSSSLLRLSSLFVRRGGRGFGGGVGFGGIPPERRRQQLRAGGRGATTTTVGMAASSSSASDIVLTAAASTRAMSSSSTASAGASADHVVRGGWDGLLKQVVAATASNRQQEQQQEQPSRHQKGSLLLPSLLKQPRPILFVSNPVRESDAAGAGGALAAAAASSSSSSRTRPTPWPKTSSRRSSRHDYALQLSKTAHRAQQILQHRMGARLLGVEQAFPIPSDHQLSHVHKLKSRFGTGGGGGVPELVIGVGSGAAIDLARAVVALTSSAAVHLLLVPATYTGVMVCGGASTSVAHGASDGEVAPPLLLDSQEATLVPPTPLSSSSTTSGSALTTTVVKLDPNEMVANEQRQVTSALAGASLVLDMMRRRRRMLIDHDDHQDLLHAQDLLGRLLRAAEEGYDNKKLQGVDKVKGDDDPLWDALFEVGRSCLRYDTVAEGGGGLLPVRPLPLTVASSLAIVMAHKTVPELMADTMPHLLHDSQVNSFVTTDQRQALDQMLDDYRKAAALSPAPRHSSEHYLSEDECMELVHTNRTLSRCRDDDDEELLRRVVADLVAQQSH